MFLIKHSLHHQYSLWYFRFFWLRRHLTLDRLRHWSLTSAVVLGIIIGLQLVYPRSFALPQTRIAGEYAGLRSQSSIKNKVAAQTNRAIVVKTPHGDHAVDANVLGVSVNPDATAKEVTNYSVRERLVPLSWLFMRKNIDHYAINTDDSKLQAFAQSLTAQNKQPVDATIKIEGSTVVVVPSEQGFVYGEQQSIAQLKAAHVGMDMKIVVTPTVVEPAIETSVANTLSAQINERLKTPLVIDALSSKITVDAGTMASWLIITSDPSAKTLSVEFDREKVRATLMTLSSKVYIAQTPSTVVLIDGETVGSDQGLAGQALLMEDSINEVITSANSGKTSASVKLQAITPNTRIIRTYTKTSKGVQALINYWVQTHGGRFGIAFRTTDGTIVASYNPDQQFTSASIYKIYVAYAVYSQVAAGSIVLHQPTSVGMSVADCLERMITWSDNVCGQALGDLVGWQANNTLLQSKGINSTNLQLGNELTTANDAATFLMQLANNNLMRTDLNTALVQLMTRQIYRQGIPSGSPGSTVADKVGMLDSWQHDVAIVYHPKGAYVLSVLSNGSSLWSISSLAKQISDVMNQ